MNPADSIVVSGPTSGAGVVATALFRRLSDHQFDTSFGLDEVVNVALLPFVAEGYDVALQGRSLVIAGCGDGGLTTIAVASQDDRSRSGRVFRTTAYYSWDKESKLPPLKPGWWSCSHLVASGRQYSMAMA